MLHINIDCEIATYHQVRTNVLFCAMFKTQFNLYQIISSVQKFEELYLYYSVFSVVTFIFMLPNK